MTGTDVPCVALVVGHTAGHTHPALATAEAIRAIAPTARMVFFGTPDSAAAAMVAAAGEQLVPVPGSPIRHVGPAGLVRAARHSLHAMGIARRACQREGVRVAIGFGGFATGGVLLAARSLRLPAVILEANIDLGLANRLLRPWVSHVLQGLAPPEADVVGLPVRTAIAQVAPGRAPDRGRPLRLLVMSSSRGVDFFRTRLPGVCRALRAEGLPIAVWQQAGEPDTLRATYAAMGIDARVESYVQPVTDAYAWADVVCARAGASTIAELAMCARPAILVPLADASANHQAANARLWQQSGAGLALTEAEWRDDGVVAWLRRVATEGDVWASASAGARRLARPDAASRVAALCLRLGAPHS